MYFKHVTFACWTLESEKLWTADPVDLHFNDPFIYVRLDSFLRAMISTCVVQTVRLIMCIVKLVH